MRPAATQALAPTGVLRVALNHGNRVLVSRSKDGSPMGIAVDLATDLAAKLDVLPEFVNFDRAVDVSASVGTDVWDICFLAVDPERAKTIAFTAPYVRIEGCYLAGTHCTAQDAETLVQSRAAVGTVTGSAYTLTLQRKPGADQLQVFEDIHTALAALDAGRVEAVAGIRQAMEGEAAQRPGARVLHPPFMEIRQAMATCATRPDAAAALSDFLEDALKTGRVGDILERHGVDRAAAILPA